MVTLLAAIGLLLLALLIVVLRKTYGLVPKHELKRQAASGNVVARELYRAVGFGVSLQVLLWLLLALTSAAGFVLLATATPLWLSVIAIAVVVWLVFSWLPGTRVTSLAIKVTQASNPMIVWLLSHSDRALRSISRPFTKHYVGAHSGLYELRDLLDLLDLQAEQPDSRITNEEISLIRQVLNFGNLMVRDVLRPRKNVMSVALTDAIGPVLLDELHASGQSSFPVKKTPRSKEIVGTLYLGDLGIHSTGTVEQYATTGTIYIPESATLAEALSMFYSTKQQLFVVLDAEEEYVGVLMLEDILHKLVPAPLPAVEAAEPEAVTGHGPSVQTVVE